MSTVHMVSISKIHVLKKRGYSGAEIGIKVGLSETYVSNLLRLLQNGEERLIDAVERGEIPMAVATEIAASSDEAFQHSLHEAYASGKLRGRALLKVRRLVEVRSVRGKALRGGSHKRKPPSARDLVRTYRRETDRQALLVKKAHLCESQIRFVASALGDLFRDENFVNLLRAESLDSLPKYLAASIEKR